MDVHNHHEAFSTNGTTKLPIWSANQSARDCLFWPTTRKRLGYTQANGDTNPPASGPITLVFEGAWAPNQVPHEPNADPDYKKWQATSTDVRSGASLPANGVVECASFFGTPPIEKPYLASATDVYAYNVTVEMEWDCQYKDLRNSLS